MDHFTTKDIEYLPQVSSDKTNDILRVNNEAKLACSQLEKEFKCIAAPFTDNNEIIFIWTHATFVDLVAYYPFKYNFLENYRVKMIYSNGSGTHYVMPTYYD